MNRKKITESLFTPIQEIQIDEENRKVTLNVIKEGWSINGYYWTPKHLGQLKQFIESSRKSYIDHTERSKFGRSMMDWCAVYENPRVVKDDNGKSVLRVTASVFETPESSAAIWERIVKAKDEVGVSIDVMATCKEGIAEGRKGMLPQDVVGYHSSDFVTEASAGGGVERIGEGRIYAEQSEGDGTNVFEGDVADMQALKDFEKEFSSLWWAVEDLFYKTVRDKNLTPKEKINKILSNVDEFKQLVSKLKVPKVSDSAQESVQVKEGVGMERAQILASLTMADIVQHAPHIVESIKEAIRKDLKEEQMVEGKDKNIETLTSERNALQESVTNLTEEKDQLNGKLTVTEKERDDLKAKVDEYQMAEAVSTKKGTIEKLLKESEIPEDFISDTFKESLLSITGEDFENQVKAKIADRKEVIESAVKSKSDGGFKKTNIEPNKIKEGTTDGTSNFEKEYQAQMNKK